MSSVSAGRAGAAGIATAIRKAIASGTLEPHARLASERELAQHYGVARGTVRDALLQLASEGLVAIRPGSGTYVNAHTPDAIDAIFADARPLEMIDARFALEPHLCRLAVLHARDADINQLRALLADMEVSADDPLEFSQADQAFHSQLAESTGNKLLIWMTRQIATVRNQDQWVRMRELTLRKDIVTRYNRQHRAIIDAIEAREPELAATLMKEHLETARLSLTRAMAT